VNAVAVTTSRRALAVSPWVWDLVTIWVVLRVWTGLLAALVSTLRPLTALEQTVALWPPTAPWGLWLQRALLAPWERWDTVWYLRILTEGYQFGNGTDAFHPFYPGLAWPLTRLGIDPLLALMIVGCLATLAFLLIFDRMAALDSTPAQTKTASHLLLFFPVAFILFAPYNEGLFLLLSALTLLCARRRRWWWAGIAGALAVLTHQLGIFLVLPFAWELWEAHVGDVRLMLRDWHGWLALGLIPMGLGAVGVVPGTRCRGHAAEFKLAVCAGVLNVDLSERGESRSLTCRHLAMACAAIGSGASLG
jgi:Predicted integral membrane protein